MGSTYVQSELVRKTKKVHLQEKREAKTCTLEYDKYCALEMQKSLVQSDTVQNVVIQEATRMTVPGDKMERADIRNNLVARAKQTRIVPRCRDHQHPANQPHNLRAFASTYS